MAVAVVKGDLLDQSVDVIVNAWNRNVIDEWSKRNFVSRGMGLFRPNERQTLKSYDEVPPEVLGDPQVFLSWAGEAIRAALASP